MKIGGKIAKNEAKKAVTKAKREASEEFGRMVESEEGRQNLFKIAKRMVRNNKATKNIYSLCFDILNCIFLVVIIMPFKEPLTGSKIWAQ